jgi:hypothetical protein
VNAWKVILATLVIFGAGVITGGLLERAFHPAASQPAVAENARRTPGATVAGAPRQNKLPAPMQGPLRKDFLNRLDSELKLAPEQRERIEKIICAGQDETKLIWQDVEPELYHVLMDTRYRICGALKAEQRAQFEKLLETKVRPSTQPAAPGDKSTNAPAPQP